MNKKIFINYRKEDSPWNSVALYQELIKHFPKGNVFKDFNTLRPGEDFVESIENALASCDVLLVLISDKWLSIEDSKGNKRIYNADDFVRLEVATALKRNICVIPVLFDNASIPQESELPDDLKKLSRRHFIEIDKTRFEADTERLVEAIKASFKSDKPKMSSLLKYVLFGIAVLAGVFLLYKLLGEKGNGPEEKIDNKNVKADTISPGIQHTEQPGDYEQMERINVSVTANPYSISAGGQTELRVLTLTKTDIPITNASIKIQAGGGWFRNSGNYIEVGKTNENGVFTTTWKSPDPAASGYGMNITVSKDGFLKSERDLTINIIGPSAVNEPGPLKRINISATANPYSISAGGQTEIRVLILGDDDLPIPNTNVKIQAGGGWFNISGNYIEVGKTNENGAFTTTWKSPNPAAKGYGMNITANKDGFLKGERDLTININ